MQIFFCHQNPKKAAMLCPPNRQCRWLQETCQMIAKACDLEPFMRPSHPNQAKEITRFMQQNSNYLHWAKHHAKHLAELRSGREGAYPLLNYYLSRTDLHPRKAYKPSLDKIVVRLPSDFMEEHEERRFIADIKTGVHIYKKLVAYKYQT